MTIHARFGLVLCALGLLLIVAVVFIPGCAVSLTIVSGIALIITGYCEVLQAAWDDESLS